MFVCSALGSTLGIIDCNGAYGDGMKLQGTIGGGYSNFVWTWSWGGDLLDYIHLIEAEYFGTTD